MSLQPLANLIQQAKPKTKQKDTGLPKAVVCDIDFTAVLNIDGKFPNCSYKLNKCVKNILAALDRQILFVTCRHEHYREETVEMLNGFGFQDYELHMRKEGPDFYDEKWQKTRPDREVKRDIIKKLKERYSISYGLDDKASVISMFLEENVEPLYFFMDTD